MSAQRVMRAVSCAFLCMFSAGCADLQADFQRRFADRYGPDPVIQSDDVLISVRRQHDVMATFYSASGGDWFDAAEAGMNYVDEKCDAYMRDLFIINRDHGRIDGILKAANTATNAVVGVTAASKLTMAVLAQSFGLAEGVNDAVLNSYLFEQIPGLVADKVKSARVAYRATIEGSNGGRPSNARSYTPQTAFKVVRNYLELCMPQTIEGKFLDQYAKSTAQAQTPNNAGSGNVPAGAGATNFDVRLVAPSTATPPKAQ